MGSGLSQVSENWVNATIGKKFQEHYEGEDEKANIRALTEAWIAKMGHPDEAVFFWNLINGPIGWRLRQNGWTSPI